LALVSLAGFSFLFVAMIFRGEAFPRGADLLWSASAGVLGAIGVALLYRGLATSQAALVAPTAALVGVALPVLVGFLRGGAMGIEKWLGIAAGMAGIWLVSSNSDDGTGNGKSGLIQAVVAGLGFGSFFVLIAQVEKGNIFGPLVVAKGVAFLFACSLLVALRLGFPRPGANKLALLAGLFDAGGNVFYLIAAHTTRLELAAVLSSMAPAVTVVLAAVLSGQRVAGLQKLGVTVCLLGIGLIVV
jgi:drug/metabolite transporter (DMT)-like permease